MPGSYTLGMSTRLLLSLLVAGLALSGPAQAQSITIGPDGVTLAPAPGQNAPEVRIDQNGIRLGVPAPAQPGRVRATPVVRTQRCNDNHVVLRGSGQRLRLTGRCASLTVTGDRNTVSLERVGLITVRGSRNTVTWGAALAGGRPLVRLSGAANAVRAAQVIAARPAPVRPSPTVAPAVKPRPAPAKPPKTATPL